MNIKYLSLFILCMLSITSCIKDEPLNMEADIIDMKVEDEVFITRAITEHTVQLFVSENADY